MLSIKVKTTQELMSIALQAERQTVQRYARLSEDMRAAGNDSAADLFERMVDEEREHERRLMAWMASESISEIPATGPIRWRDPQVSTTYDDEARDPHYSTPYKALAFAVNNEDNAFRFYTHVAAEAEDESVRLCAEALAHEELEHAELFRAERRRAYHAERATGAARPPADPGVIHSEADLLATALRLDGYFCDAVGRLGEERLVPARAERGGRDLRLEGAHAVGQRPVGHELQLGAAEAGWCAQARTAGRKRRLLPRGIAHAHRRRKRAVRGLLVEERGVALVLRHAGELLRPLRRLEGRGRHLGLLHTD